MDSFIVRTIEESDPCVPMPFSYYDRLSPARKRIYRKSDAIRAIEVPDLAALQRNVDATYEMGFIKSKLDVKAHSDLSLIQEAAKRPK